MTITPRQTGYLPKKDGHSVYWETHGAARGTPVLLIHGGFGHTFDLEKLTGIDLTRHNVIIMHQRGFGRSAPSGETTYNELPDNVDDIERLRKTLRIGKWSIFAWSAGNVLMTAYAAQYPQRCATLTAYAPYFGSDDDYDILHRKAPETAARYFAFHNAANARDIVTSVFNKAAATDRAIQLKNAFNTASMWSPALDEQTFYKSRSPAAWDDYFRHYILGAAQDLSLHTKYNNILAQSPLTRPVNLIYGARDIWTGPHGYAVRAVPRQYLHFVADGDHDVHNPAVQNALKNIPLAP